MTSYVVSSLIFYRSVVEFNFLVRLCNVSACSSSFLWHSSHHSFLLLLVPSSLYSLLFHRHTLFLGASCQSPRVTVNKTCIEQQPLLLRFNGIIFCQFQEGNTCVSFNSSSRYLLTGGKSKTLSIWDMKTKSIKKTYKVSLFKEKNVINIWYSTVYVYVLFLCQLMLCTLYIYS